MKRQKWRPDDCSMSLTMRSGRNFATGCAPSPKLTAMIGTIAAGGRDGSARHVRVGSLNAECFLSANSRIAADQIASDVMAQRWQAVSVECQGTYRPERVRYR